MKRYTKSKFITELATQITISEAHNVDKHPNHRLAVYLANALWRLNDDDKDLTDTEIDSVISCFK